MLVLAQNAKNLCQILNFHLVLFFFTFYLWPPLILFLSNFFLKFQCLLSAVNNTFFSLSLASSCQLQLPPQSAYVEKKVSCSNGV